MHWTESFIYLICDVFQSPTKMISSLIYRIIENFIVLWKFRRKEGKKEKRNKGSLKVRVSHGLLIDL